MPRIPSLAGTLVGVIVLFSACAIASTTVSYNMPLQEVHRPTNVAERWGDFTLNKSEDGFTYEDDLLRLLVVPAAGRFLITIHNKTPHSMQFIWDQASYVGFDGFSSPVSAGDTRCIQIGQSRPPETIPPTARAIVTIIPKALVYTPYGGGCAVRDFVPRDSTALKREGNQARLLLPLRVQETINEYTLVFRISDVTVKPET